MHSKNIRVTVAKQPSPCAWQFGLSVTARCPPQPAERSAFYTGVVPHSLKRQGKGVYPVRPI